MDKRILALGVHDYGIDEVELCDFKSNTSLSEGDIILLYPQLAQRIFGITTEEQRDTYDYYKKAGVWKGEIDSVLSFGTTVIAFLPGGIISTVFVSVYHYLPITLNTTHREGKSIKIHPQQGNIISPFWQKMEKYSRFEVILEDDNPQLIPCLTTRNGGKSVGAIFKEEKSKGSLVLLPLLDFKRIGDEKKGKEFANAIISLDKALKGENQAEQAMFDLDWFKAIDYKTEKEIELERSLSEIQVKLRSYELIRCLLYTKGSMLEKAVRNALSVLGFETSSYTNPELDIEIDAVFSSEKEGIFIGEAEGKDKGYVKGDKIGQLVTNALGYSKKEGAGNVFPKRVLFGNAYREHPLGERGDPFSRKCVKCAKEFSVISHLTQQINH